MKTLQQQQLVKCEYCQHARITQGKLCRCDEGHWRNRSLSDVEGMERRCGDFDDSEE